MKTLKSIAKAIGSVVVAIAMIPVCLVVELLMVVVFLGHAIAVGAMMLFGVDVDKRRARRVNLVITPSGKCDPAKVDATMKRYAERYRA